MTVRERLKVDDMVRMVGGAFYIIVAVELEDKPRLGVDLDMGRYTLLAQDGSLHYNQPGYLLRKWKEIK